MHIFQVIGLLWIYNKLNLTHFIISTTYNKFIRLFTKLITSTHHLHQNLMAYG